ncbi:tRNA lysidine(34) synthetase TilS [Marinobacter orientalis]|uniref:tRNA(Ile)-lysidine synthase n=1 Tax=Marinobacter orientalis TaxID=1928859 RepID=A0A7Y0RFR2_9GAMM|nr:tRNA lysidine(34) synthetase TilS [Marinobacter orientalis]NMT65405.1 tRNA lysidine(34) synthetase TilS [Marinobacter orientalis]TGX47636.1 tRNA lysidine(34) synthetase TilS [Marinobacter orientalis]
MTRAGNPGSGSDWPEVLCAPVSNLPSHSRLRIALSGGMDSVLLLHIAARLYADAGWLSAVHVNHQLQTNAVHTEGFCRQLCERLGVPLDVRRVSVEGSGNAGRDAGGGIEEAARNARYRVFEQILTPGELLLMAHHGDDQAETVLFRLLRGTGVAGLGGMPSLRPLGNGLLYRPLLDFSREELQVWAMEKGIDWVDDPSNTDQRFDRNFLRQSIIPVLKTRWPSLVSRMAYTARACREHDELAGKLAELRFRQCANDQGALDVDALVELGTTEQKNLLHWWIRHHHHKPPTISNWPQVLADLLSAQPDREPELRGAGFAIRRYQRHLYLVPEQAPLPSGKPVLVPGQRQLWGQWRLTLTAAGNGETPAPEIRISTRAGGERLRPTPNGPSKSLKNWLQEKNIPPWERSRLPLLVEVTDGKEEVVGAGDLWLSGKYSGQAPASGWRIDVERECN